MKARLIAVAACSLLMTQAVQSAEIRMLAEALLQIAIVLISVSIVATLPGLRSSAASSVPRVAC